METGGPSKCSRSENMCVTRLKELVAERTVWVKGEVLEGALAHPHQPLCPSNHN